MNDLQIPVWMQMLLGALAGGGSVYAAIRADLAEHRARILNLETGLLQARAESGEIRTELHSGIRGVHDRIDRVLKQ